MSIATVITLVLAAGAQAQDPELKLDAAIELALKNNLSLRRSQTAVGQAKDRLSQSKAGIGPQFGIDSTYTRFDKASTANFGGSTVVVRPIDSKQSQFRFSMPIDLGGKLSLNIKASKENLEATKLDELAEANGLKLAVRESYYRILQSRWNVLIVTESLETAKQRLKNAELRYRAGELAKIDVIRFQTQIAQFESDLISANNGLALNKKVLNNLLSREIDTPFEPVESQTDANLTSDSSAIANWAIANRAELSAAKKRLLALGYVRRFEERGLEPGLSMGVTHSRDWGDLGLGGTAGSTTGVLTLSWPIFDSGLTKHRSAAAKKDEELLRLRLQEAELGVALEVKQAYTNYVNALARLKTVDQQMTLSQETYRLATLRYENGEGIQLEVIDAQTGLTSARVALNAAKYDILVAFAQLQKAVGKDELSEVKSSGVKN